MIKLLRLALIGLMFWVVLILSIVKIARAEDESIYEHVYNDTSVVFAIFSVDSGGYIEIECTQVTKGPYSYTCLCGDSLIYIDRVSNKHDYVGFIVKDFKNKPRRQWGIQ